MRWFSVGFGSFLLGIIFTVVLGTLASSQRPRYAKAEADARAMGSAIRVYVQHCGGLPAGDTQDCPIATETGGPFLLPRALVLAQTNRHGQRAGPLMAMLPAPPPGWTGAGASYAYYIFPGGKFLVCSHGDGMAMNSDGGSSCP